MIKLQVLKPCRIKFQALALKFNLLNMNFEAYAYPQTQKQI